MDKIPIIFFLPILIVILCSVNSSNGDCIANIQLVEMLLLKCGKDIAIETILEKRGGCITLLKNNKLAEFSGTPDPQYVTPQTILIDLEKIEISPGLLEVLVKDRFSKKEAE